MPNFRWMQGLWLAVVKIQTHVFSNVYKQTDESQWFLNLGSHSYEDLAKHIFAYTKEYCPRFKNSSFLGTTRPNNFDEIITFYKKKSSIFSEKK